ncbi:MAG TPA: hypothetical protein VFM51_06395 [Solirubrobacterales bacterium]|nr:hypothetical protein [Solirubrobacterales bacterium]
MERTMWTDERLDDLAQKVDAGFERVDADIRELRSDIGEVRTLMFQLWGTNMLAILATIATVIVTSS